MNRFTHQNARQFLFGLDNANFLAIFDNIATGYSLPMRKALLSTTTKPCRASMSSNLKMSF